MSGRFLELNGIRVYEVSAHGPELRTGNDAVDLMSAAAEQRAAFIAIPVERLGDDFFELRTGIAGELVQKFAMYGTRVVIIGEISQRIATSKSLAAFLAESNRGQDLWFVRSLEDLSNRLGGARLRVE
jgi:hypothetical protein